MNSGAERRESGKEVNSYARVLLKNLGSVLVKITFWIICLWISLSLFYILLPDILARINKQNISNASSDTIKRQPKPQKWNKIS